MPLSLPVVMLVAFLAGVAFCGIGLAYRFGQSHGVEPMHILLVVGAAGAVWFGARVPSGTLGAMPAKILWLVVLWGVGVGAAQYVSVKLITAALRRGPLSPPWCMVNLNFLVATAYAVLRYGEHLSPLEMASVASAIGCVLFASRAQGQPTENASLRMSPLLYGLLLTAILVFNGLSVAALKELGGQKVGQQTYVDCYGAIYFCLMYAVMGLCILADLVVRRGFPRRYGMAMVLGLIGAGGSIGGLTGLGMCAASRSVAFTVAGVSGIVVTALISVLGFKEKVSLAWIGMVGLGVLSVVVMQLEVLAKYLRPDAIWSLLAGGGAG